MDNSVDCIICFSELSFREFGTNNAVITRILYIKGNSTKEAHEKSKNQMLKNIKKVLRSKTQESFLIAESLWNNYIGQELIGNEEALL